VNMNTRIEFLNAFQRGDHFATAEFLPKSASSSETADTTGSTSIAPSGGNSTGHYKPHFKFGTGGGPLGNEFEVVTDEEAYATIEAAWNAKIPTGSGRISRGRT
jgi:D-threo-aldose 1-dehydrogenase